MPTTKISYTEKLEDVLVHVEDDGEQAYLELEGEIDVPTEDADEFVGELDDLVPACELQVERNGSDSYFQFSGCVHLATEEVEAFLDDLYDLVRGYKIV